MNTIIAFQPFFSIGGSVILSWLLTFVIIAAFIWFIVWVVTKLIGPPSVPEPFRWVIWMIVIIVIIIALFSIIGIRVP